MGEAQRDGGLGNALRRIMENIATEHRHEQFLVKALCAPTHARSEKIGRVTHGERLRVAAITPVSIQVTDGVALAARLGREPQIRKSRVVPTDERLPR